MRIPPKVLDSTPSEIKPLEDRITIMKNPTLANDFIWHFDNQKNGIHIQIHAELKNKSNYEWSKDEKWEWFVNISYSERKLKNNDYKKSIPTRSFREAVLYANEYARNITDIKLKPKIIT